MAGPSRRGVLALAALLAIGVSGMAQPSVPPIELAVAGNALGAVVAAVAGDLVAIKLDKTLGAGEVRVEGVTTDVTRRLRLKGEGEARGRFLDDPRNAAVVGAAVRDALTAARPLLRARLRKAHVAWSRVLATRVLAWQEELARSATQGRKVRDVAGRIYLLEWAGWVIDPTAADAGPPGLAQLPAAPTAATAAAYEAYVAKLVAAVVAQPTKGPGEPRPGRSPR